VYLNYKAEQARVNVTQGNNCQLFSALHEMHKYIMWATHTHIPNVKSNGTYSGHCALTFSNSILCPQCALACFILLTEWTAITP